ncbi:MAG: XVIPCD domain-containing protein [Luteimonas sp.]
MSAAVTPLHRALHPGDHGHAVRELQKALNRIGCTDVRGHRLVEDGRFGTHTRDALATFQRAHGLPATGIAGVRTAHVLHEEDGRLVTSPAHPDHRLFEEVLKRLHAAESARGTESGPHALRVAAALVVEMRRDGVARADRVELNRDGSRVRAVQVSGLRDEPGLNRMTRAIDVGHAAQQSLRDSSGRLAAADIDLAPSPPLRIREQPALLY